MVSVGRIIELSLTRPLIGALIASATAFVSLGAYLLYRNDDEKRISPPTKYAFGLSGLALVASGIALTFMPSQKVEHKPETKVVEQDAIPASELKFLYEARKTLKTESGYDIIQFTNPYIEHAGKRFNLSTCGSVDAEFKGNSMPGNVCENTGPTQFCKQLGFDASFPLDDGFAVASVKLRYYGETASIRRSKRTDGGGRIVTSLLCIPKDQ